MDTTVRTIPSVAKELAEGRIHADMLIPYPTPDAAECEKVASLLDAWIEYAGRRIDPQQLERERWIGDDVVRELGELGLMGVSAPECYGGQGLSESAAYRLGGSACFVDPGFAVVMGIHQSIGMKGLLIYGNDEQRERVLPDLASGRKLAGFA